MFAPAKPDRRRRLLVVVAMLATVAVLRAVCAAQAAQVSTRAEPSLADFREDFESLLHDMSKTYAYFDAKATHWSDVAKLYDDDLNAVKTRREFVTLLERVLDELYDSHLQLTVNTAESPRLVPSGADVWAEWTHGKATVTEVRQASDAERAGVRAGDVVTMFDGITIERAVDQRLGRAVPRTVAAARDWALRAVLAGRHNEVRRITLVRDGRSLEIELGGADQFASRAAQRVEHSVLDGSVGYIRFNDSLGDSETIQEFDRALADVKGAAALLIDLRNTPSGGNSTVARAVLGRFVDRESPYQKHVLTSEFRETGIQRSWLELVSPRGAFVYNAPVAVLVDHWTGSMGEGLAIGFNAVRGAALIGTRMAGLLGATYHLTLTHTGIGVNVPAERLFHVNGTPRESVRPDVEVDMSTAKTPADPILKAGIDAVRTRARR